MKTIIFNITVEEDADIEGEIMDELYAGLELTARYVATYEVRDATEKEIEEWREIHISEADERAEHEYDEDEEEQE